MSYSYSHAPPSSGSSSNSYQRNQYNQYDQNSQYNQYAQNSQYKQSSREPTDQELDITANALVDTFASSSPPPYTQLQPLSKPFCLPCTGTTFDDPFERGYCYELQRVSISQSQWLDFVDGLNLVHVGSPALRIVDTVGMVVGFLPSPSAMAAGAGLQVAARTGMRVLSKTLTDRYLRSSNLRFFHPRGLSVRLVTTRALRVLIGMREAKPEATKTRKFFSGAGNTALSIVSALPVKRIHGLIATVTPQAQPVDPSIPLVYRRLNLLHEPSQPPTQYILGPINFDVPPPMKVEGIVNRMGSVGLKMKEFKNRRKEKKQEKKNEKGGREGTVAIRQLVAQKKDKSLVWIVLMPMERDQMIQEISVADAAEDVDRVDVQQYEYVAAREKDENRLDDE